MQSPLIISLGGSMIIPDRAVNVPFLKAFRKLILRVARHRRVIIVTGGGGVNRQYNAAAKDLSRVAEADLDWIGIAATRLNAELVRSMFGAQAFERVLGNPAKKVATTKQILVGCGWLPGSSSDKDAVLLARTYSAREIVNISNIPYVFDKDPKKHKNAKQFRRLSWEQYRKLIAKEWSPRLSTPFDPIASRLAEKNGVTVYVISGKKLTPFKAVLAGKPFRGTVIHPEAVNLRTASHRPSLL